ncbi:hypothetical protein MUK70_00900 [Dyadobacter chenwenxiniae]|uniref:YD repeat-containing protein n=1 Tax=Dyadobacter chenwenxiniae TaxID=2906456 RepID=A0A9X1TFJ5_9BACT|nr:hypothetical protein [Dyadobacter chenwenxiniae]MCF0062694.1 hypothetical protein [Dyadobacter chenwenxiniae]UON83561.1 hypothetical protein MUK70_00900 [Dyadobacter chenwenxiniae]
MKTLYFLLIIMHVLSSCKNKEIDVFEGVPGPNVGDTSIYNANHYRLTRILNFSKSDSEQPYGFVEFAYDAEGNLERESMIDNPDLLAMYKTYTYKNGRMATQKIFDGQVNRPTLSRIISYTYQDDLLSQEDALGADGELQQSTYYVYTNGKLSETYKWTQSLGKHHHYKYAYDSRGNVIREQAYMYNNDLEYTENYTYDVKSRKIKTERFNHSNMLELITIAEYTANNILPSAVIYQDAQGNQTSRRTFELDVAGNQIQTSVGNNTINKRKYYGKLLREEIRYSPQFGFTEFGMTRYEYEKK